MESIEARVMLAGNGLSATYFDNADLTGKAVSRVDTTVNFNWGTNAPVAGIGVDTFSVRWSGSVEAGKTENYTFYVQSDDGARLWINDKLLINDWTAHAAKETSATIALTAGQRYNIKLEYFDQYGGASAKLSWSSASTAKQVIPTSQLYSTAAPVAPSPIVGTGNGLLGTYFDNADLTGKSVARTDKTVAFDFGAGVPITGIGADTFSVRWAGQVMAPVTQEYTFHVLSDDGVRLWVNGTKIIDAWTQHAPLETAGKIKLEAGKKYDIKLEYFDNTAGAVAKLYWSGPATVKQLVPTTQLFSTAPVTPPTTPPTPPITPNVPTGKVVPGLLATYFSTTAFGGNSVTRVDPNIAFDWGTSSPEGNANIGSDGFSARWVGQITAPKSETYNFHITSDEGVRLWVGGKLIIDQWTPHAKGEASGSIALVAGQKTDIKVEYYDLTASAVMQLRWSSASIAKQFVPTGVLTATLPVYSALPGVPGPAMFTGYKTYTHSQVNFRPGGATDKALTVDGYNISNIPIDTKGLNVAVTDLVPGQKAFAYSQITIKNTEISGVYRTPGFHNDFIRIAGAAGRQDVLMNIDLENISIHDGTAIPILITDGDYDTIVIRNVKITNCSVAQLQINTQNVGSVKRIIVENCPGLSVAMIGRAGTIGECLVRSSPGAKIGDSLNQQGTKSGVKITVLP